MRSLREWVEIVKKSNNEGGHWTLEKSGWGNLGRRKKRMRECGGGEGKGRKCFKEEPVKLSL